MTADGRASGDAGGESRNAQGQGLSYIPYQPAFPSAEDVDFAASAFCDPSSWAAAELTVAPGLLRIRVPDDPLDLNPPGRERATSKGHRAPDDLEGFSPAAVVNRRGAIISWSAKSRLNMCRRFATLDYTPWTRAIVQGWAVVMVTLTYPSNWEQVAPSNRAARAHFDAFRSRLRRALTTEPSAIWKREFQARGAPHYHLLIALPSVIGGEPIAAWVSRNWYEIVGSRDPRHLAAGTGLDWAEPLRGIDPVRVAQYFAVHAAPGSTSKEYQNSAPSLWVEARDVGRFWGYWGLDRAESTARLSVSDVIEVRRLLRGLDRSRLRTRRTRVRRVRRSTGLVYYRHVRRRHLLGHLASESLTGASVFVSNGPGAAETIARFLASKSVQDPS